ncbi:hypothetical protein LDO26_11100 [Luteimonas sp. BDR2-5]|uniref:SecDF P1 head subdomain-containing protein n=1 Tax=Proluteimonas luteida TaxID=2878685 RepID=UPI001E580149|nr:hypothetical protein [Luteimonas sp. BDR2-5]MCD9028753.1 hypothetical protein [Luteimonas sp. BDR2-5]
MRHTLHFFSLLACLALLAACNGRDAHDPAGTWGELGLHHVHDMPGTDRIPATSPHGDPVFLEHVLTVAGDDVLSVDVGADPTPVLDIRFSDAAGQRIEAVTAASIGRQLAITSGDRVLAVATVAGPFSSSVRISGETLEDARAMRNAMRRDAAEAAGAHRATGATQGAPGLDPPG